MLRLIHATEDDEYEQARELFLEYVDSLGVDLSFQNISIELQNIPGEYAPPDGCILLALDNEQPAGCVALRKIDEQVCEMKRLYVTPEWKGSGVGKKLALAIIDEAKIRGYSFIRLDTLPTMEQAIQLYRSLEFYPIEP